MNVLQVETTQHDIYIVAALSDPTQCNKDIADALHFLIGPTFSPFQPS